jgi:GDP-L-fucose synthase
MHTGSRIYVAGHCGMVGSAIVRELHRCGYLNLLLRTRQELDLRAQAAVRSFFEAERPEYVFLAAARVGGIVANSTRPAEFIYDNLAIQTNVIAAAAECGVAKLAFLGSSCIYPKFAEQPIREEALLTGALEPTNESYAIAKIAGLKLVQAYHRQFGFCGISLMPTNLYGPRDNYDLESSHVVPALLRKFHEAARDSSPRVEVWGSGTPRRELLYVDDLAVATLLLMERYESPEIINVGTGEDISIAELAQIIARVTGFKGRIVFDTSRPDGTPRKLLDISRIRALGWQPRVTLEEGLARAYRWYLENLSGGPARNQVCGAQQ